ncbi:MAG TPA: glycosyltransferase [Stellaceae bacterium]|nr:glycosyltransferase [Stellaceae bacterium]
MLHFLAEIDHWALLLALAGHTALGGSITWLVVQHLRLRDAAMAEEARLLAAPLPSDEALPHVLVQIPTFNEGGLIRRAVAAVGELDWPRDRLHVQVCDDSTDSSTAAAAEALEALRAAGIDALLLHRTNRGGFKAGALGEGLQRSAAEFVAIFDADYVPPRDFLRRAIRPLLADPGLALVQARCDYLNGGANAMTYAQQRILDAHFGVEQATRSWTQRVLPFNGTCGIFRRRAIDEAGGWRGDTLAEDLDLSYRIQLLGWRARFLVTVSVPGELPENRATWATQQHRWNKGFAEVARKLLPSVWRSRLTFGQKLASTIHLGGCAFGALVAIAAVSGTIDFTVGIGPTPLALFLLALAVVQGVGVAIAMMLLGQRLVRGADMWTEARRIPMVIAIFLYGAMASIRGVVEVVSGRATAFVRTPKTGGEPEGQRQPRGAP